MHLGHRLYEIGRDAIQRTRIERGRWPLTIDTQMSWDAGEHAAWLFHTNSWQHTEECWRYWKHENIAKGNGNNPEAYVLHAIRRWLSDQHAFALLDEGISRMGFGIHVQEIRWGFAEILVYRSL